MSIRSIALSILLFSLIACQAQGEKPATTAKTAATPEAPAQPATTPEEASPAEATNQAAGERVHDPHGGMQGLLQGSDETGALDEELPGEVALRGTAAGAHGDSIAALPATTFDLKNPKTLDRLVPDKFRVRFVTTKGDFVVEVQREWAPVGAERFYNLVVAGYFQDIALFRVVDNFVVQFGIHGDPQISAAWAGAEITDDPVSQSNQRGMMTFATAGPNTRTTQIFINLRDNLRLDNMGFAPFARVIEGMNVVDAFYNGYGERPDQSRIGQQGNTYLKASFPNLDYILSAEIVG